MSDLNLSVVEDGFTVDGTPRDSPLFAIKNSAGETLMETEDKELAMLIGNASHVRTYLKHLAERWESGGVSAYVEAAKELRKAPGGL